MPKATLVKEGADPIVVESGSQEAQEAFGQGYQLPEEMQAAIKSSYDSTGAYNPASGGAPNLAGLQGSMEAAGTKYDELSKPNTALRILQEAIRKKNNTANAPIGESEIFKQAGVGGMGALSASLNARSTEIKTNFANFSNIIGQMSGTYKEMAGNALTKYQIATDNYNRERDYLEALDKDMRNHEQAIEMLNLQDQFAKENIRLRDSLSGSGSGAGVKGEDEETTHYYDTLQKSAEGLIALRDSGRLSDTNYKAEVDALMASFEWPEERRGEMESELNNMMSGDVNSTAVQVSTEDVANDWLGSIISPPENKVYPGGDRSKTDLNTRASELISTYERANFTKEEMIAEARMQLLKEGYNPTEVYAAIPKTGFGGVFEKVGDFVSGLYK